MRSKVAISKSVSAILVVTMFGLGAVPSLPAVYASTIENSVLSAESTSQQVEIDLTSGQKEYTATVANRVKTVTLAVKGTNVGDTVSVNGQIVKDGVSQSIPLLTGDNTINISVNDGTNTTSYTVNVTREKSSNNLLQDILLSKGELSPKFDATMTSYQIDIPNDVDSITILPIAADNAASMKVNDDAVTDTGVKVQTPVGNSKILITVSAENGDKKTYTLNVTRKSSTSSPSTGIPSSGTASHPVTGSTQQRGSANPTFMSVKNISANFNRGSSSRLYSAQSSAQGASTAQKPNTATLTALSVSSGTWNKSYTKDAYTYHIAVGSDMESETVTFSTTYSGASVTINGGTSNVIQLENQKKTIVPIVVTNGSDKKNYVLVFDKNVTDTTTATTTTDNSDSGNSTSTSDTAYKSKSVTTNSSNNQNSTSTTSWWSRLLEGISSFFSKL